MATRTTTTQPATTTPATQPVRVRLARWRINVLFLICLLLMARVFVRLADVQIVRGEHYSAMARAEFDQELPIRQQRGVISDRLGNVLAMDVDRQSLWVMPHLINPDRAPRLATAIATLTGADPQTLLATMQNDKLNYARLVRWLEPETAEQIAALGEVGLQFQYETRRIYPQGMFAAQIVGAVNHNHDGISGIEAFFNPRLKGVEGSLSGEFDPGRNPIAIAPSREVPPIHGLDITLTIDPLVQYVIERELTEAVERHQADGGSIVVIDPRTGAIRGMASWPLFDPNNYTQYPAEVFGRNPAISNLYEPGSTFKIFTVAAGLQSRAFTADTLVNDTGTIFRHGFSLKNWNAGANGMLDSDRILYFSSNVGALQLNELTGPEDFYSQVAAFGFGRPTGVELAGEEHGIVNAWGGPAYNDLTFLTNAYGQGISVTPLQMVQAMAAVANNGVMMRPYIVERVCEDDGERCTETQPVEVGRPIEPGVAWTVRRMLVNAANHYAPVVWGPRTGSYADQWLVPGYQVGAKTGTSSIPLPGGGYDPSYTIGSVLGFAPAEEARYAVLVKIDRPKDDIWGVATAIPVFYNIIDQLMRYERIPPDPALVSPGQTP
jgi:cell division protein FtsI/penicillin-binding protein 2